MPALYSIYVDTDSAQEIVHFLSCANCGKYVREDKAYYEAYCSEECATGFTRCELCGKYYQSDQEEHECCPGIVCRLEAPNLTEQYELREGL